MRNTFRIKTICLIAFTLFAVNLLLAGCNRNKANEQIAVSDKEKITLVTTASIQDSGLLDFLLSAFASEKGWEVDVLAVDSLAALEMGREGKADVLLVNARADEFKFVEDDYGIIRFDVMDNYGVILVNPTLHPYINAEGGYDFVNWIISDSAQTLIGQYGIKEFGGALFTPNADANFQ